MLILKSKEDISRMKAAGEIAAGALKTAKEVLAAGVTTRDVDSAIHEFILENDAYPSFLGYRGFPAASCISINEEVIHGIPSGRVINNGDIVSVDVGVIFQGFHGDNAATFAIGEISPEDQKLLDVTRECLFKAIAICDRSHRIGDIGSTVEGYANVNGFSVVKAYTGHGLGRKLHESPDVPNFGIAGRGLRLIPGMTIAVEPMINMGGTEIVVLDDGWTVITEDNKRSAHFEMSIAVTDEGPIVLTDWREVL